MTNLPFFDLLLGGATVLPSADLAPIRNAGMGIRDGRIVRLGALKALRAGSTLIGDRFVHADVTLEAMAALGMRVHASRRVHDVDIASVAHGEWRFDPKIGARRPYASS